MSFRSGRLEYAFLTRSSLREASLSIESFDPFLLASPTVASETGRLPVRDQTRSLARKRRECASRRSLACIFSKKCASRVPSQFNRTTKHSRLSFESLLLTLNDFFLFLLCFFLFVYLFFRFLLEGEDFETLSRISYVREKLSATSYSILGSVRRARTIFFLVQDPTTVDYLLDLFWR